MRILVFDAANVHSDREACMLKKASGYSWILVGPEEKSTLQDRPHRLLLKKGKHRRLIAAFSAADYSRLQESSEISPVVVIRGADSPLWRVHGGADTDTVLWLFQSRWYESKAALSADDVIALIGEQANRERLKLEKARALQAMTQQMDDRMQRQHIPQQVKVLVWQRDGGRCVQCGSQKDLHYDHIIPVSMGGSSTDRNLQILCEACNLRKGATIG